jgi:hypothetical protein
MKIVRLEKTNCYGCLFYRPPVYYLFAPSERAGAGSGVTCYKSEGVSHSIAARLNKQLLIHLSNCCLNSWFQVPIKMCNTFVLFYI